jgi:hypothetical protein
LAHRIPNARNGWYHDLLAFHVGLVDADDLLKKAGKSRVSLCEANFCIGLRKLAEGKRREAKECFKSAVDTNVFTWDRYFWSRAYLALIDDPDWLPWIPVEK